MPAVPAFLTPDFLSLRFALSRRQRLVGALAILCAVSLVAYGPAVTTTGLNYDDWSLRAAMSVSDGGSPRAIFEACDGKDPASRALGCAYHAAAYWVFGDSVRPYHALSLVLLVLLSVIGYLVLTRVGWSPLPAVAAMAIFVLYPGSDSSRFWVTGAAVQFYLLIFMLGMLAGVAAVQSESRRRGIALHAGAAAAFLLSALAYEAVLGIMAANVIVYQLARPGRRALVHGAVDLALAFGLAIFRLTIHKPPDGSGFVQTRDLGEQVDRVWTLVRGGWNAWQDTMAPGAAGAMVAGVAVATIVAAFWLRPQVRRALRRDLIVGAAAAIFALAGLAAFFTANDYYVPVTYGLFNRINSAAAFGYCVLTVALLSAWARAGTALGARRLTAGAVAAMTLVVSLNLMDISRDHLDSWQESSLAQGVTLSALRDIAPSLPEDAVVVTFGHAQYEKGYIPIFSSTWDLRGALSVETHLRPPAATPFDASVECGQTGLVSGGAAIPGFRYGRQMYFVNTASRATLPATSAEACARAVRDWGRPPMWGRTVTG